jgi:chromosome partitioning protein
MAQVIAVVNQKGGVGKTTTSVNLAAFIANKGKNVLLIDIDPQGNASSGFGIDKKKIEQTTYDVLINQIPNEEVIVPSGRNRLSICRQILISQALKWNW